MIDSWFIGPFRRYFLIWFPASSKCKIARDGKVTPPPYNTGFPGITILLLVASFRAQIIVLLLSDMESLIVVSGTACWVGRWLAIERSRV